MVAVILAVPVIVIILVVIYAVAALIYYEDPDDNNLLRPRGLAGKPLAGFRATPSRRITVLYGMVM